MDIVVSLFGVLVGLISLALVWKISKYQEHTFNHKVYDRCSQVRTELYSLLDMFHWWFMGDNIRKTIDGLPPSEQERFQQIKENRIKVKEYIVNTLYLLEYEAPKSIKKEDESRYFLYCMLDYLEIIDMFNILCRGVVGQKFEMRGCSVQVALGLRNMGFPSASKMRVTTKDGREIEIGTSKWDVYELIGNSEESLWWEGLSNLKKCIKDALDTSMKDFKVKSIPYERSVFIGIPEWRRYLNRREERRVTEKEKLYKLVAGSVPLKDIYTPYIII